MNILGDLIGMDGMVEENGSSGGAGSADPLAGAGSAAASSTPHVVAVTSIVQLTLPSQAPSAQVFVLLFCYFYKHNTTYLKYVDMKLNYRLLFHSFLLFQVQSVIQPNQQSVIQTASNIQSVQLPKGNVILVSKPSSVIHTTQGTLQTLQV